MLGIDDDIIAASLLAKGEERIKVRLISLALDEKSGWIYSAFLALVDAVTHIYYVVSGC